ncbi:MAG: response regulator transcription factor [Bacteroidota bacterium]
MKISCVIVEDEPLPAERLREYISKIPYLELTRVFDNGMDALVYLKLHPTELLFLDINLGELSGIRMLENHALATHVILTTAYHEFALKGYELNVCDYLLKPFTFERFLQAVEKVREREEKSVKPEKRFIFLKTEHRLEKVMLSEIRYIEGMRDYRRVFTTSNRIMTLKTFREFEQELPPDEICRVHKSYMVALAAINAIEKDEIRIGEKYIPISDTYRKEFYERVR